MRYDSVVDGSLSKQLHNTIMRSIRYVGSSVKDFLRLLRSIAGLAWLTLLVTTAIIVLLKLNQELINSLSVGRYLSSPLVQVLIAGFGVLVAYKITKIAGFVWLWLGPHCRWLRVFSVIIIVTLCICVYLLLIPQDKHFYLIAQALAIAVAVVGTIGSLRELLFDYVQRGLVDAAKTLKDRYSKEHFDINGQRSSIVRLSQLLSREKDPAQPLTIAIDGEWGTGKATW